MEGLHDRAGSTARHFKKCGKNTGAVAFDARGDIPCPVLSNDQVVGVKTSTTLHGQCTLNAHRYRRGHYVILHTKLGNIRRLHINDLPRSVSVDERLAVTLDLEVHSTISGSVPDDYRVPFSTCTCEQGGPRMPYG